MWLNPMRHIGKWLMSPTRLGTSGVEHGLAGYVTARYTFYILHCGQWGVLENETPLLSPENLFLGLTEKNLTQLLLFWANQYYM